MPPVDLTCLTTSGLACFSLSVCSTSGRSTSVANAGSRKASSADTKSSPWSHISCTASRSTFDATPVIVSSSDSRPASSTAAHRCWSASKVRYESRCSASAVGSGSGAGCCSAASAPSAPVAATARRARCTAPVTSRPSRSARSIAIAACQLRGSSWPTHGSSGGSRSTSDSSRASAALSDASPPSAEQTHGMSSSCTWSGCGSDGAASPSPPPPPPSPSRRPCCCCFSSSIACCRSA